MSPDRTQLATALTLLFLAPVAAFILDRSTAYVALSLVCVVLVTASLYVMFGPADGHEHDTA